MIEKGLLEKNMRSFMYVHPARRRNPKHLVTFLLVVGIVAAIPISAALMQNAGASLFPKPVSGYVYDTGGLPVQGANVTVKMYNGVTLTGTQYYTPLSDADGFYFVTFAPAEWEVGYTISITVTKNLLTGTNTTLATDAPDQWLNATLGIFIPEFSGYAVVIVGGFAMLAILAVKASPRRAKPL